MNKSDSVKSSQEDIFKECEDEEVNKKDDQVEVKSSQEDIFEFKSSSGDSYFHEDDEARMRRKKAALAAFDPDEAVKMEYEACIENAPPKSKDERGRKLRRNFLDRRRNLFKRILSQDKMKPESKNKKKIHNGDKSQPSIKQFIDGGGSNDKDVDELFHLSEGEDEDGHENDFEDEELSDITLEKLVKYSQESRNINEVFEKYRKMKEEDEKYEEKQQKLQNEAEKRRKFEEENEKLALNLIETLDDEQFLIGLMDQHWDALKEINAAKGDKEHPVNEICDRLYIWNQDKSTRKALINYTITQPFSRAHQTVILNYFKEKLNIRTEEERINNEEFIWMVLLPSAYIRLYASVFGFELKEAEERIKATPIKDEDYWTSAIRCTCDNSVYSFTVFLVLWTFRGLLLLNSFAHH